MSEILDLDNLRDGESSDTVDLFKLGGKTYTIPAKPHASVALRYLRDLRKHGEEHAMSVLLESVLGEEGYEALIEANLSFEQFQMVVLAVQKHLMGAMEDSQGNG